jgi:hypothetical protein
MKNKFSKTLPLLLAGALQVMPMLRTILPMQAQGIAPSTWAIVLKLAAGGVAIFGFHGISSASSIAISPPNATVGVPYVGTVTYSGGHSGDVHSMKLTNNCLSSSFALAPGLTIIYSGANNATVSGTPTTAGTYPFRLTAYSANNCGSGDNDSRTTSLIVGTSGGGGVAPSFTSAPENGVAQVGSDVLLSAGASGNPVPGYYWKQGVTIIPNATNSTLSFANVQLTNAGLFTVTATNSAGTNTATAYLSVCVTAGSNILALHYTNYIPVSNAVIMSSYITNAPAGSNVYKWQWQYVDITSYSTSGNNLSLPGSQVFAGHSGVYSVTFNGVVGATTAVNQQQYDSYWAFGSHPVVDKSPQDTNVLAGTDLTLAASAYVLKTPYTNQPVSFRWYRDATNLLVSETVVGTPAKIFTEISGGSLVYTYSNVISSLTLTNVSDPNNGIYTVVASNFWGSVTSSPAALTVTSTSVSPPLLQPQLVAGGGSFQLAFTNNLGATFTVLGSTNIALPVSNWTALGPATEISPGQYQFTDPGVFTNRERYYLIRSP